MATTSQLARAGIEHAIPSMSARVFDYIKRQGVLGATDDEIEVALTMRHQTVSARRRELVQASIVVADTYGTGRRETRSGATATVWVAA